MKILVTGSNGFVGRNLVENLKSLRDGKDRTRPELKIDEIYEYDIDSTEDDLVSEMLDVLEGKEHRCEFDGTIAVPTDGGRYCAVPTTHRVTLGEIVELLRPFMTNRRPL